MWHNRHTGTRQTVHPQYVNTHNHGIHVSINTWRKVDNKNHQAPHAECLTERSCDHAMCTRCQLCPAAARLVFACLSSRPHPQHQTGP